MKLAADSELKAMSGLSGSDITVLSTSGRYMLPSEQQEMMCLTSDGTLYVSDAHRHNTYVLAYRERLNRGGIKPTVKLVRHTDIEKVYKKFGASNNRVGDEASLRQSEVIRLIREGVGSNASDIHFRVEDDATRIKMRIDGDLEDYQEIGLQHGKDLVSTIYQSMCDVAQPIYLPERSQDARLKASFTSSIGLKGARVGTRPSDVGQLVVLRLLYHRERKASLPELGFLPEQIAIIRRMMQRTEGINIIGGPTGAGKSTTLETVLTQLLIDLQYKINLITVEDPPEYEIPGAVATPVQYPSDATDEMISQAWAKSISNLMRLDPDVAMVGEIRDNASAIAAFRLAITGHGIYTTVHSNDVVANLVRLLDIGVDVALATDPQIVTGLVSQRLTPRVCPSCRRSYAQHRHLIDDDVAQRIEKMCNPENVYLRGEGCTSCRGKGIKGRILVPEVMMPTKGFMQVFRDKGASDARNYWVKEMDGITRNTVLIKRINEGIIDPVIGEKNVCALDEDLITLG